MKSINCGIAFASCSESIYFYYSNAFCIFALIKLMNFGKEVWKYRISVASIKYSHTVNYQPL